MKLPRKAAAKPGKTSLPLSEPRSIPKAPGIDVQLTKFKAEMDTRLTHIEAEIKTQTSRIDVLQRVIWRVIWPLIVLLAAPIFGLLYKALTG